MIILYQHRPGGLTDPSTTMYLLRKYCSECFELLFGPFEGSSRESQVIFLLFDQQDGPKEISEVENHLIKDFCNFDIFLKNSFSAFSITSKYMYNAFLPLRCLYILKISILFLCKNCLVDGHPVVAYYFYKSGL